VIVALETSTILIWEILLTKMVGAVVTYNCYPLSNTILFQKAKPLILAAILVNSVTLTGWIPLRWLFYGWNYPNSGIDKINFD